MGHLRMILGPVIALAALWAVLTWFPRCTRVQTGEEEQDITGIEPYSTYRADGSVAIADLRRGDAIAFRAGGDAAPVGLAWVAALPGDAVAIHDGGVFVNGERCVHGGQLPAAIDVRGPVRVPADHLYIITTTHTRDGVARGFLPAAALVGRIRELP